MLADDIASVLPELQAQAESMMITPCLVTRGGSVTADPLTGADVVVPGATVYEGGCKVQTREGEARTPESADSTATVQRWEVHVPVSAGPFLIGDVVDAQGRMFRVAGVHTKSWQTAQRLPVEEVL